MNTLTPCVTVSAPVVMAERRPTYASGAPTWENGMLSCTRSTGRSSGGLPWARRLSCSGRPARVGLLRATGLADLPIFRRRGETRRSTRRAPTPAGPIQPATGCRRASNRARTQPRGSASPPVGPGKDVHGAPSRASRIRYGVSRKTSRSKARVCRWWPKRRPGSGPASRARSRVAPGRELLCRHHRRRASRA